MMDACIDHTGTVEGLEKILEEASARAGGILLLTCDGNGYEPRTINPVLGRLRVPVAGGLFPAVFVGNELLERGSIAVQLPTTPQILAFGGKDLDHAGLRNSLVESGIEPLPTMLVLTDGLAFNANTLLDALFDVFGLESKYLGGGAGSLTLQRRPCLITNKGMTEGGALVVALNLKCGIGVAHGHMRVGGPYQITAASGHVVHSIDWRPAASYYRELIQQYLQHDEDDSGGVISRNFCLAINRLDADFVVREPVKVCDDESLEFATAMQEGELVDIVRADSDKMQTVAFGARDQAKRDLCTEPRTNLCFTCCSRRLFLGDNFDQELRGLESGGVPIFGAITVGGEIANNGESYLDYYNRTCVVGSFEV